MNTATWSLASTPAAALREALHPLGFTAAAGGYERHHLRIEPGPGWWYFTRLHAESSFDDAGLDSLGQPGLWKWLEVDGTYRRSLVLPAAVFSEEQDAATWDLNEPRPVLEQVLRWAETTMEGQVPEAWKAPERAVVESWFSRDKLTVVAGDLLCQGELIWEPARLALRFQVLPQISPDLPPARLAWLRELLKETHHRWHLVRCGFAQEAGSATSAAMVEVDLTGAPPPVNETLFATSLEALRGAVQWLGEPADWLADPTVVSELLAVCPKQEPTKGTV